MLNESPALLCRRGFRPRAAFVLAITLAPASLWAQPYDANLITYTGDTSLSGAGGDAVSQLRSPAVSASGDLGFSGALDVSGNSDGFIFFDDQVVWRVSIEEPGLGVPSVAAFGDSAEWIARILDGSTQQLWSDVGLVLEEGDTVTSGSDSFSVLEISPTDLAVSGDGEGFWQIKVEDAQGSRHRLLASSVTLSQNDIVLEFTPDSTFDGYQVNSFFPFTSAASSDGSQVALGLRLMVGGSNKPAIVEGAEVKILQGDLTGENPNEWWSALGTPNVNVDGDIVFRGSVRTPSTSDVDVFGLIDGSDSADPLTILREGDSVCPPGGGSCTTFEPNSTVKDLRLSDDGHVAYLWVEPSSAGADEYLAFACSSTDATAATILLSRFDGVDFDGDGSADATVDRVGLASPEGGRIAIANGSIYVGAELYYSPAGSGLVDAILELPQPTCLGS